MAVKKNNTAIKNSPKHLLGIQSLSIIEAKEILDEAKEFIKLNRSKSKKLDILRDKTQIKLFFLCISLFMDANTYVYDVY